MSPESVTEAAISLGDTTGPGSYGGLDWLVAVNICMSTALALIAAWFGADLVRRLWANRGRDRWNHPVTSFRATLLLFSAGIFFRKASAALVLWQWNPAEPAATGFFLRLQRYLDPVADGLHIMAFALICWTVKSMVAQLRITGWPVPIWEELKNLYQPGMLALASFVAGVMVVVAR